METLLSTTLIDQEAGEIYEALASDFKYGIFYGFIIKNKYDEARVQLPQSSQIKRLKFITESGDEYKLYGILNEIPQNNLLLKQLMFNPPKCMGDYTSILNTNRMSCVNCFLHFSPGLYPIDEEYRERFFTSENLNLIRNESTAPAFQKVSHIYLFALVNHSRR